MIREAYPQPSGLAAEQGTAAHYVAMHALRGTQWQSIAPNGVLITPDMVKGAEWYRRHIEGWGVPVYVEQFLSCADIHPECAGTPDVWGYCWERNMLFVCDYKYGFLIVDAFENWQLLCYVFGALAKLRSMGVDTRETIVQFTVVQPRVYSRDPEPWIIAAKDLEWYLMNLQESAALAISAAAQAVVGEQCDNCDGSHACDTLKKSGYRGMALSEAPHIHELTLDQASYELARIEDAIAILQARASGLGAQLEHGIQRGARTPMHEMERIKRRETWQEGRQGEVIMMGKLLGKDLAEPVKALSPSKVRQLGIEESIIKQYSDVPTGELKLVRMSTKSTRKMFGDSIK